MEKGLLNEVVETGVCAPAAQLALWAFPSVVVKSVGGCTAGWRRRGTVGRS